MTVLARPAAAGEGFDWWQLVLEPPLAEEGHG
jgi:hypothetical protein